MKQRSELTEEQYKQLLTFEQIAALKNSEGFKLMLEDTRKLRAGLMLGAFTECDTAEKWFERKGRVQAMDYFLSYVKLAEMNADDLLNSESEMYEENYYD